MSRRQFPVPWPKWIKLLLQLLLLVELLVMLANNSTWYVFSLKQEEEQADHHRHHRAKRYLDFTKGSRMSWRCIVKNNILNVNTIWAYGFGFRANFPFPDKLATNETPSKGQHRQHSLFRRELFQSLAYTLNGHGLDGEACLLKAYCTAHLDHNSSNSTNGILLKLLRLIFTLDDEDERHLPYLRQDYCHQILHSHCPLSLNSISPYTDI